MPTTIRSLKRLRDEILPEPDLLASPKRKKIETFMKGYLLQGDSGRPAMNHMANTAAAQKARAHRTRAGSSKRRLQSGGIMYAGTARLMIKDREEEELRKARMIVSRAEAKVKREAAAVEKQKAKEQALVEKERVRLATLEAKTWKQAETARLKAEKAAKKAELKALAAKRMSIKVERAESSGYDIPIDPCNPPRSLRCCAQ